MRNGEQVKRLLLVMVGVAPLFSVAADLPFPPARKEICTDGTASKVDKERVATYLLRKYPLTALAGAKAGSHPGTNRQLLADLLANKDVCATGCGESDQDYLDNIYESMNFLLKGHMKAYFAPSEPVSPPRYFAADDLTEIMCLAEAPNSVPPQKTKYLENVRVRGDVSQLYIDRTDTAFKDTDKATLSVVHDEVALANSSKATAYVGFSLPTESRKGLNGQYMEFIPYVGVNRNVVTPEPGSTTKPSHADTDSVGVLATMFFPAPSQPLSHRLTLRPEVLVDHDAGSNLRTLNAEYTPERRAILLNQYRTTPDATTGGRIIFTVKNNYGKYADPGKASVASSNKDFDRLGANFGLALFNDNRFLPFDISAVYTKLHAVSGETDISYMKTTINFNLDPDKKYFGVSFKASHGIKEDTAKPEHKKEIALAFRF